MTSSFAFQTRKDDIHSIAEQDAIPLRAPAAPLSDFMRKVSSSSSLCELAKPTLQPLHTNLASLNTDDTKLHKISEKASWSERVSMAFCRNAAIADGTASHDDMNKYGIFSDRSPLTDYSFHQDKNQSLMSSLPSFIISSAAECPSIFDFASCEIQKPLGGYPNCQDVESDHAIKSTQPLQRSFLISQIINPIVLMPEKPATLLPDLNVTVQKVDNPDRDIPDCCSPSSKSSRQISMPDDKISESGWTIYLNQSTDLTPGTSFADLSHSDSRAASHVTRNLRNRSAQHKQHCAGRNLIANIEDSSMISDASSGPEQPFLYQDAEPFFEDSTFEKKAFGPEASTVCKIDDLMDDACTSKVSCESISNGLPNIGWRMSKRRKRGLLLKPCPPLQHDTPNTRQIMTQVDGETNCNSFEGSGDNLHIEAHTCTVSKNDEGDLLDDRMEMLKQLIPNSEKLDREEVLAVAIDYVKSLEQKIKMFETSRTDMADLRDEEAIENFSQRAALRLVVGLESAVEGTALQERGLCLMPVSMFGKAL